MDSSITAGIPTAPGGRKIDPGYRKRDRTPVFHHPQPFTKQEIHLDDQIGKALEEHNYRAVAILADALDQAIYSRVRLDALRKAIPGSQS